MVCKTIRMDSTEYNRKVAANISAAIDASKYNPTSLAREAGMPQSDMFRKLKSLNGASFTVGNLAVIACLLETTVPAFFPPLVA